MKKLLVTTALAVAVVTSGNAGGSPKIIKITTPACRSDVDADAMAVMAFMGDKEGLEDFLSEKLKYGDCTLLQPGTQVFVEDVGSHPRSTALCVRPQGQTKCAWIFDRAALDDQ